MFLSVGSILMPEVDIVLVSCSSAIFTTLGLDPGCMRLSQPLVSCFLTEASYTHLETYQKLFSRILDTFSSRFFKTNAYYLHFLFYKKRKE